MTEPELIVTEDVAEEATAVFLAVQPDLVLLTGGGTPRVFYQRLAELDHDWTETEFFLSDERCVPFEDDRSNAGMCQETLVSKVGGQAYWMNGADCDAPGYEAVLRERFRDLPRFDMAVYGLGPDGHTASLFPGRPEVDVLDRWVVEVPQAGVDPYVARLSLTVPVLSSAAVGVFLVSGEDKRGALRRLLAGEDIPAARLAPDRLVVLADRVAAA
jgi:6-phosphogluconolactonase